MLHELNLPTICPRHAACERGRCAAAHPTCLHKVLATAGACHGQKNRTANQINDSSNGSGNSTSATEERLRSVKDGNAHARCLKRIPKVSLPLFLCQRLQLFLCVSAACLLQLCRADHAAKADAALAASQSRAVLVDARLPGRRLEPSELRSSRESVGTHDGTKTEISAHKPKALITLRLTVGCPGLS